LISSTTSPATANFDEDASGSIPRLCAVIVATDGDGDSLTLSGSC
jgi:hypothetical protein